MNARRPETGFTIVEVLVALAIFVLAAVALGSAYLSVLKAYERGGRGGQDPDVVFARAAALAEPDLETVEKGGDFDGGNGRRVRWTVAVLPTETADLFTVDFTCEISATDLPKPEVTKETFRVLRPTWSKPDEREKLRLAVRDRIQKITQQASQKP